MMQPTQPATTPAPASPAAALLPSPFRFRRSLVPAALRALADELDRRENAITVEGHEASEPGAAA